MFFFYLKGTSRDGRMFPDIVCERPLMLMIGNLPSRRGAFTSRLLLYQIPSEADFLSLALRKEPLMIWGGLGQKRKKNSTATRSGKEKLNSTTRKKFNG